MSRPDVENIRARTARPYLMMTESERDQFCDYIETLEAARGLLGELVRWFDDDMMTPREFDNLVYNELVPRSRALLSEEHTP